jgi:hypothetical protein
MGLARKVIKQKSILAGSGLAAMKMKIELMAVKTKTMLDLHIVVMSRVTLLRTAFIPFAYVFMHRAL